MSLNNDTQQILGADHFVSHIGKLAATPIPVHHVDLTSNFYRNHRFHHKSNFTIILHLFFYQKINNISELPTMNKCCYAWSDPFYQVCISFISSLLKSSPLNYIGTRSNKLHNDIIWYTDSEVWTHVELCNVHEKILHAEAYHFTRRNAMVK